MRHWPIAASLLVLATVFASTYPGVIVNSDEAKYIRQANAFAHGELTAERINPLTGERKQVRPSDYPPGTSLLLVPFVAGGWRGAFWFPFIALVLAVVFTALTLWEMRWPPWCALILLVFPPTLVMARVATSDVVSAAIVALGLWLFWRGAPETRARRAPALYWLASGLTAGISLLFRDTNVLLFAPLFAGAAVRGNKGWWWLLAGGVIGTALRPIAAWIVFGDPLFSKAVDYGFSLDALIGNAPIYLLALTVLVPGGLVFVATYRGFRAPEVIGTATLFVCLYMAYEYSGRTSSLAKSLVLGPRFFIPLLPVIAFAMGESAPRLMSRVLDRPISPRLQEVIACFVSCVAVISVNLGFDAWTRSQAEIQAAILENVPRGAPVISNPGVMERFLNELQGYPTSAAYGSVESAPAAGVYVVFLQRSDSDYWINAGKDYDRFLSTLETEVVLDQEFTRTDRLRILRVVGQE